MGTLRWSQAMLSFGAYPRDGWATMWPELAAALLPIYRDEVARFPFVPGDWLRRVEAEFAAGNVLVLAPAQQPGGAAQPGMPAWIATDAQRHTWTLASRRIAGAVEHFARGEAEAGRVQLDQVARDRAFWDGLIRAVQTVADLPGNVVGAVSDGASRVAGGVLGALFKSPIVWAAIVAGGGYAAWRAGLLKRKGGRA